MLPFVEETPFLIENCSERILTYVRWSETLNECQVAYCKTSNGSWVLIINWMWNTGQGSNLVSSPPRIQSLSLARGEVQTKEVKYSTWKEICSMSLCGEKPVWQVNEGWVTRFECIVKLPIEDLAAYSRTFDVDSQPVLETRLLINTWLIVQHCQFAETELL